MYRDFTAGRQPGLQHVAYWTENYDADLERSRRRASRPMMSGRGRRARPLRLLRRAHTTPGTVIELSEVAGPKGKMFRLIREASESWDGSDPVRPFPDLSTEL